MQDGEELLLEEAKTSFAARTLYVSLDRADNVIDGCPSPRDFCAARTPGAFRSLTHLGTVDIAMREGAENPRVSSRKRRGPGTRATNEGGAAEKSIYDAGGK
jgi:hypothetical protein